MRPVAFACGFAAALTAGACGHTLDEEVISFPTEFSATAYCLTGTTQSGVRVQPGIVAADPAVLPVGSIVSIGEPDEYSGIYSVLDTGSAIKGERLDIYIPDCDEAREFGVQTVTLDVLRHGWDPQAIGAPDEVFAVDDQP